MSTVLLVEDSRTHRKMISALLKDNGFNVLLAKDGVEALETVQRSLPALIILDIIMPRMNGYEVCRRIKGDATTKAIAVVMFSAKSEAWDFFWGSKQGADAYVSKLCHPQELLDTVRELLDRSAALLSPEPLAVGELKGKA